MAIKGRNKPRTSNRSKKKTTRSDTVTSTVKRLAPRIISSMLGPTGAIAGMALPRERDRPQAAPSKPKETSLRPKPRPETSLRPKPRPKSTSLRPKIRPTKKSDGGSLKAVPEGNKGLKKLPTAVRNKMGFMKHGGSCKGMGAATRGGKFSRNG